MNTVRKYNERDPTKDERLERKTIEAEMTGRKGRGRPRLMIDYE